MAEIATIQLRFNLGSKSDKQLYRLIQSYEAGARSRLIKKVLLNGIKNNEITSNKKLKSEVDQGQPQTQEALVVPE